MTKKKLLFLLLPIVIIGVLECGYSAIFEKDTYIYMFNHPDDPFGGYNHEIGATFGNKEDWGAFLSVCFVSAFSSILFLENSKKEIVLKFFLGFAMCLFTMFAVLSLCKTAILSIVICLILIVIGLIVISFYKSKKLGLCLSIAATLIFIVFITFLATGGFGVPILKKISDFLIKFIINRAEGAVESRSEIWLTFMQNMRGFNLFFGMGKANVNQYSRTLIIDSQSTIHNGIAYFIGSYGIIGFAIFVSLLVFAICYIVKTYRINQFYPFAFLGILLAGFIFVLAESEVLIISTSTPVFIYNILAVMLPIALCLKDEKRRKSLEIIE